MTRLHDLFNEQGQSPWLDNLRRDWLESGELAHWIEQGVRGLTSNPTIFEQAITTSDAYDVQLEMLTKYQASAEEAYWSLVQADIEVAAQIFSELVYEPSSRTDGFVSVEIDPRYANDPATTSRTAKEFSEAFSYDNVYIKIPATKAGVGALEELVGLGKSINMTLLFSLKRYEMVLDAYIAGLEECEDEDLSHISGVASFFISRVETAVDNRLKEIGTPQALELVGKVAVAQAVVAYDLAQQKFSSPRFQRLEERGARIQRPLWASTSTKNADYTDTKYVDELIGPDSVNTIPDKTLTAFLDHGKVERTIDIDVEGAKDILARTQECGVDLEAIADELESAGLDAFQKSFESCLTSIDSRLKELA